MIVKNNPGDIITPINDISYLLRRVRQSDEPSLVRVLTQIKTPLVLHGFNDDGSRNTDMTTKTIKAWINICTIEFNSERKRYEVRLCNDVVMKPLVDVMMYARCYNTTNGQAIKDFINDCYSKINSTANIMI